MFRSKLFRAPVASVAALSVAVLVAGPALAASSSTSASAASVAIPSNNVVVQLPFNRQIFSSGPTEQPPSCVASDPNPAKDCIPYFDLMGNSLPATSAPKGNVQTTATDGNKVVFQFPAVTTDDSLSLAGGQAETNIPVTPGNYSAIDLLTGAGNGPAPLTITLKYSDGSTSTADISVPDWFKRTPTLAVVFPGRWEAPTAGTTEQMVSAGIGLYSLSGTVDKTKTLSSISIADTGTPASGTSNLEVANIVAITLEGTASGTAPTSAALSSASFSSGSAASSSTASAKSTSTSTATSSTSSGGSSSVPKTGAGDLLILEGAVLVAVGAASALLLRAKARRS